MNIANLLSKRTVIASSKKVGRFGRARERYRYRGTERRRQDEMASAGGKVHRCRCAAYHQIRLRGEPKRSNFARKTIYFPTTRLGVEAVIRRAFDEARRYLQAWERYERDRQHNPYAVPPRRDLRLEALADILRGNLWVHCHAYRADEMLVLVRLARNTASRLPPFNMPWKPIKLPLN